MWDKKWKWIVVVVHKSIVIFVYHSNPKKKEWTMVYKFSLGLLLFFRCVCFMYVIMLFIIWCFFPLIFFCPSFSPPLSTPLYLPSILHLTERDNAHGFRNALFYNFSCIIIIKQKTPMNPFYQYQVKGSFLLFRMRNAHFMWECMLFFYYFVSR